MGDLRPLGSERLEGMDKIKRIMEIARYNEAPREDVNNLSTIDYTIQLADGNTYGIVKEKLGYIIKKGLNESELDYTTNIRDRKYFNSYSQAMKKLNLMVSEINRLVGNDYEIPLIGEQEENRKKFVLKTPKPKAAPAPAPEPMDVPPAPAAEPTPAVPADDTMTDMSSDDSMDDMDLGMDDMGMDDMEDDTSDDMDFGSEDDDDEKGGFKMIQKLTGKLSQKLRALNKNEEMDSQDIKYVLNSIISALDISNLDEEDKEDILDKFDNEEEMDMDMDTDMDLGMDDMGGDDEFDFEDDTEIEDTETEESYDMMDGMFAESKVDSVISKYFTIGEEEKTILEEKEKRNFINQKLNKIKVETEIKKLSESFRQYQTAIKVLNEGSKFVGKTNKENLIFNTENGQIKVTPRGQVI